jgi:5-methylthioadenosine/S-adenosylhomocysteine deaminase
VPKPRDAERDLFEAAYTDSVSEAVAPPSPEFGEARELLVRAAPAEAIALRGCVLTPTQAIENGYVVVGAGQEIEAVKETKPQGVTVHDTGGVILPGLIDLHGHPEFNVFAAWEPPEQFVNRYACARLRALQAARASPAGPSPEGAAGEDAAALRGGSRPSWGDNCDSGYGRPSHELSGGGACPQRRQMDLRGACGTIDGRLALGVARDAGAHVDLGGDRRRRGQGFLHSPGGGRSDNGRSRKEFDRLVELNALTDRTVVIHGTALTKDQLGDLKDAGAKLVWSPQSNLRLHGETTKAADALAARRKGHLLRHERPPDTGGAAASTLFGL